MQHVFTPLQNMQTRQTGHAIWQGINAVNAGNTDNTVADERDRQSTTFEADYSQCRLSDLFDNLYVTTRHNASPQKVYLLFGDEEYLTVAQMSSKLVAQQMAGTAPAPAVPVAQPELVLLQEPQQPESLHHCSHCSHCSHLCGRINTQAAADASGAGRPAEDHQAASAPATVAGCPAGHT